MKPLVISFPRMSSNFRYSAGGVCRRAAAMIIGASRLPVMLGAAAAVRARGTAVGVRAAMQDSIFQHPDGEGRRQCGLQSLYTPRCRSGIGFTRPSTRPIYYFDRP